MTKYNEIQRDKKVCSAYLTVEIKKQNVFDSERWSDSSFTVQEDTEVIHREVKGGTQNNCKISGETVRILGNTSTG